MILKKLKLDHYVDRKTITRVSGVAMEFYLFRNCNPLFDTFKYYLVPIIVTIIAIIAANICFIHSLRPHF